MGRTDLTETFLVEQTETWTHKRVNISVKDFIPCDIRSSPEMYTMDQYFSLLEL